MMPRAVNIVINESLVAGHSLEELRRILTRWAGVTAGMQIDVSNVKITVGTLPRESSREIAYYPIPDERGRVPRDGRVLSDAEYGMLDKMVRAALTRLPANCEGGDKI